MMKTQSDTTFTLRGAMTALVTPFREGAVDVAALTTLIERQVEGGIDWLVPCGTTGESPTLIDWLVPCGTTGESPTLTAAECDQVLAVVLKHAGGRCGVLAGAGTNNTIATIERCRRAADAGVHAVMLVAPYYNRPPQEGLYRHYATIAEAVDLPIVLYNVPTRTGVKIAVDTVVRLRQQFGHIVAIKDATGELDGVTELLSRCDITVLSGDDTLTWPMLSVGAEGVISVISNLCPSLVKSMVDDATGAGQREGLSLHRRLFDLAAGIGRFGSNPLPIKTALALRGLIAEEFRLPLCPLPGEARAAIEQVLRRHELLGDDD